MKPTEELVREVLRHSLPENLAAGVEVYRHEKQAFTVVRLSVWTHAQTSVSDELLVRAADPTAVLVDLGRRLRRGLALEVENLAKELSSE